MAAAYGVAAAAREKVPRSVFSFDSKVLTGRPDGASGISRLCSDPLALVWADCDDERLSIVH